MAIFYDSKEEAEVTSTSLTYAHTCTGNNRILFVGVGVEQAGVDPLTGVTYAGSAMTLVDKLANVNTTLNYWVYLYYLIAPTVGSNNVVISSGASGNIRGVSVSYTGAKQSAQPDATNKSTSNTTDLSIATTVVAPYSWIVSIGQGFGVTPTAGSGLTSRTTITNNNIGDSNGPLSAGSNTIHWTYGSAQDLAGITASFAPDPSSGGFLAFM